MKLQALTPERIPSLSDDDLLRLFEAQLEQKKVDRQENQLKYLLPVSEKATEVYLATEMFLGVGGGNRASKSDTCLSDLVICATGIIPDSLKDVYPRKKIRGPINTRVVCESHTTTTDQVILRKLKWFEWNGLPPHGGTQGHWGWIPKHCLVDKDWSKSWSAMQRTLTFACFDPDNPENQLGWSTLQIMSHDQDPEKAASGEFHVVMMDEPPKWGMYRENRARIMSVGGRLMVAMTWPDDPAIPVDWLFDELYEPGQDGPNRDPDKRWIELSTLDNQNISQEAVQKIAKGMTEAERITRIQGKPIRFAGRIHPLFTETPDWWCFQCGASVWVDEGHCERCEQSDIVSFVHAVDFEVDPRWPTVFVLDPHPRKPHMWMWVQVDGNDDKWVIAAQQGAALDGPTEVSHKVQRYEKELGLHVTLRLMDPNMGRSSANAKRKEDNDWQHEFEDSGLFCELADRSSVGRQRVNDWLRPDPLTRRPSLLFHIEHAALAIHQMNRYVFRDKKGADADMQPQMALDKHDDYPSMLKYLANADVTHTQLREGAQILDTVGGGRRDGY